MSVSFKETLRRATECGDPSSRLVLGRFFASNGKGIRALHFFRLAAEQFPPAESAAKELALLFYEGCGDLAPDFEAAEFWLRRAANEGGSEAARAECWHLLGRWLETMTNNKNSNSNKNSNINNSTNSLSRSLDAWTNGAILNSPSCIRQLASRAINKNDYSLAVHWLSRGAHLGDQESIKTLAKISAKMLGELIQDGQLSPLEKRNADSQLDEHDSLHGDRILKKRKRIQLSPSTTASLENGEAGSSDSDDNAGDNESQDVSTWSPRKIVREYLKHAEAASVTLQDPDSILSLAKTHASGLVLPSASSHADKRLLVAVNPETSLSLFLRAFRSSQNPSALLEAAKMLYNGSDSVMPNIIRAIELFHAAAEAGSPVFVELGDLVFKEKDHLPSNFPITPFECYRKAMARNESVDAYLKTGDCLRFGRGGATRDPVLAFEAFESAMRMDSGHPGVVERVACALMSGEGCVQDIARAKKLMKTIAW